MAEIEIRDGSLVVWLRGWDGVWALRRRIAVPLVHVGGADVAPPDAARRPDGLRLGGTSWPGKIVAGTYWRPGERTFWCVRDPAQTITVELRHERYARLVLQVADPPAAVASIRRALAGASAREAALASLVGAGRRSEADGGLGLKAQAKPTKSLRD